MFEFGQNNLFNLRLLTAGYILILICMTGCSSNRDNPTLPDAHPESWLDSESPDFHGNVVVGSGVAGCAKCHGDDLDGGKVNISCIDCHATLSDICTGCHGGLDNNAGAPPYGLRGEDSDTSLAVGAHTAHLTGSSLAGPVPCEACHNYPAFVFDSTHLDYNFLSGDIASDSIAEIVWHGIADGGDAHWDRNSRNCTGTYCHGGFAGGYANNSPVWTSENQADCGSCHDAGENAADLLWKHDFHVNTAGLYCADCHNNVVDTMLAIGNPDLHINGMVNTQTRDTTVCNQCHGSGPSACTGCHGGIDNLTGAPPSGLSGETATSQLAVGAHTQHLDGGYLTDGIECTECHVVPASLIDQGHLDADSVAEMTWGTLAGDQSAWNRTSANCSGTYCHGNFTGGYSDNAPVWTSANQAQCGSCHDNGANSKDLSGKHKKHIVDESVFCNNCHSATINGAGTIISRAAHVDGVKTVSFPFPGTFSNGSCSGLPGQCHDTENWQD